MLHVDAPGADTVHVYVGLALARGADESEEKRTERCTGHGDELRCTANSRELAHVRTFM